MFRTKVTMKSQGNLMFVMHILNPVFERARKHHALKTVTCLCSSVFRSCRYVNFNKQEIAEKYSTAKVISCQCSLI